MRKLTIAKISALLLLQGGMAMGQSADPCTDPNTVALNSWLLEVNDADQSSREDLIASMKLLATGGFTVNSVFAYDQYPGITYAVSFDPGYWAEQGAAARAKEGMLAAWARIPGNLIRCNGLVFPASGGGVQ